MFRKLKQKISVLFIGILAVSVFPLQAFAWSAPTDTDWEELSRDNLKARFAVGSDIHIPSYNSGKKLENALNAFYKIDPDTDAVIFAGDLTDNGAPSQYDTMMDIANNSELSDKIVWAMGNHEYYNWSHNGAVDKQGAIDEFTAKTGQVPDKVVKRGGITIVTLGSHSEDGGDYSEQYDFLRAALEDAAAEDPNAPIFVIAHHGVYDSAYTTQEWYGHYGVGTSHDMVALMAQYPQVIHISGHSHATVEDPRSIDQSKGFTCIQDGTLGAYFENESGKINSNGSHTTYPENNADASQALIIDVDNSNKVTIKRMDLTTGEYIYGDEPWVIDVPELVNNGTFPYTNSRISNSKEPVFPAGAKVTVNEVKGNSVAFSFDQAEANGGNGLFGQANDDMVHSYKMKVTNTGTGEPVRDNDYSRDYYLRFSDYYRENQASTLSAKISGLSPSTEYQIEVKALTPYGVESSNSISATFTTSAESDGTGVPTAVAKLTNTKPVIDGELESAVWSLDNTIQTGIAGDPEHKAAFDAKWDKDHLYVSVKVTGDNELAAGTGWSAGDIVWVYIDPTLHAGDYILGDGQLGIGYNPDDKNKPYLIMGGGVLGSDAQKAAVLNSITAAAEATDDGWNAEIAIPWQSLGINPGEKNEIGFDITVDDYHKDKDLTALAWCVARNADTGSLWRDTSGFGKLELEGNVESVLDVDFSDGLPTDQSSAAHVAAVKGEPVISDNGDLGKKTATFDGVDDAYAYQLTSADYDDFKNSFTMECMMKLKKDVTAGDPFMNCEGAGLGFEINGNNLEFWAHINGAYTVPSVNIEKIKEEWVHGVATYDGTALKLYINGKLEAEETVTGTLDIPEDSAKWLMIGADTGSNGGVQNPAACDISNARLYGGAMASGTVAKLFAKDTTVITLSNNNALTGTVGQAVTIPSASAKNANGSCAVSIAVTGPKGDSVTIQNNTFTPAAAGTYMITYTSEGQKLTKTVVVAEASNTGDSHSHHSSGSKSNTPDNNTAQTTEQSSNTAQPGNIGGLKDVSSHWAKKAIDYVVTKGILKGTGEGKFDPDKTMTRGMIATVLWRMGGSPAASGNQTFADVSSDAWYKDAVSWAAANQIAAGTGNGFSPDGNVTREQLAVILYNYARYAGLDTTASADLSGYSDNGSVSSWAADAMKWAVGAGLITGKSEGNLSPRGASTRAEVATILMRFNETVSNK